MRDANMCNGHTVYANAAEEIDSLMQDCSIYTALQKFGITWSTDGMPEY